MQLKTEKPTFVFTVLCIKKWENLTLEFADIYYDISDYLAYAKKINPQNIFFFYFLFFVSMLDTVGRYVWKRFWQFNQ